MKTYVQLTGLILLLLTISQYPLMAQRIATNLNIVFIGNSITHGVLLSDPSSQAPPAKAAAYLERQSGIGRVSFSNQGVSGFTTVDFLPSTGTAFNKVAAAAKGYMADETAVLIFSIILGTNDSAIQGPNGSPVSPENYRKNLEAIANKLLTDYPRCRVIFHYPTWYSPNTYNGAIYLQAGLDRLQTYFPEIDALVKDYHKTYPGQVSVGDKQAFSYFKKHYLTDLQGEEGWQGVFYLHPNRQGAAVLGEFWGKAIYKAVR
ncbi:Lysophospholipase L1 [Chitinophaga sp. CF118]|uniref:GDSL-type esterase/lipase family protein n=1 Tax=Chitinophaga sp. CF118 TaxID=1884367 RepID=UPI0008ED9565|nr:GDSL-type esterase/lipase family protein [Chitinophaga sp. CF118]SFD03277.1 Lysophospholipase L1 [Chitinophaga sp. CF118]